MTEWRDGAYPTNAALRRIVLWPLENINDGLDFVAWLWWMPYGGVSRDINAHEAAILHSTRSGRYLRLATGGWSGNESIIAAMEDNAWFRRLWRLSARGGLHIYEYLAETDKKSC